MRSYSTMYVFVLTNVDGNIRGCWGSHFWLILFLNKVNCYWYWGSENFGENENFSFSLKDAFCLVEDLKSQSICIVGTLHKIVRHLILPYAFQCNSSIFFIFGIYIGMADSNRILKYFSWKKYFSLIVNLRMFVSCCKW